MRLVLASASPRRIAYLRALGVPPEVQPARVPEHPALGESPEAFTRRVAHAKVQVVARTVGPRWILGADTVVALGETIFGKPADKEDARRMLRALSGRVHRVCTAIVLRRPDGGLALDDVAVTRLAFRHLGEEEIDRYLQGEEYADKAGAYAVQGGAARFVSRIEGSFSSVVGLPLELLVPALQTAGLLSAARAAPAR